MFILLVDFKIVKEAFKKIPNKYIKFAFFLDLVFDHDHAIELVHGNGFI